MPQLLVRCADLTAGDPYRHPMGQGRGSMRHPDAYLDRSESLTPGDDEIEDSVP
jgi:hypothetical protein